MERDEPARRDVVEIAVARGVVVPVLAAADIDRAPGLAVPAEGPPPLAGVRRKFAVGYVDRQ